MECDPSRYIVAHEICFSPANEDGCIILNVARDSVLSLNATGAFIFAKVAASERGITRGELVATVQREFPDEPAQRIESAVRNLLHQLEEQRVLRFEEIDTRPCMTWVRIQLAACATSCVRTLVRPLLRLRANTAAAVLMLTMADAILKLGGFSSLHTTVKRWKLKHREDQEPETIATGCAVVEQACVWHPKQKLCLQRSAVVTCLLRSLGVPAEMVIGVHKMPFYGHSWVEVEGRVVNDHRNVQAFFQVLSRC